MNSNNVAFLFIIVKLNRFPNCKRSCTSFGIGLSVRLKNQFFLMSCRDEGESKLSRFKLRIISRLLLEIELL